MNATAVQEIYSQEIEVSFDDITGFLEAAQVYPECPACGNLSWSIVHHKSNNGASRYPTVPLGSKDAGIVEGFYLPVIFCVCKRCSYMRMHSMSKIADWVADGKKAIPHEAQ